MGLIESIQNDSINIASHREVAHFPARRNLYRPEVKKGIVFVSLILFLYLSVIAVQIGIVYRVKANSPSETSACAASDTHTLSQCVEKVNNLLADAINITTLITCVNSQESCSIPFKLSSQSRSRTIKIFGTSPQSGFKRIFDPGPTYLNPNSHFIKINGDSDASVSVEISDLSFEDFSDSCATPDVCANIISVVGLNSISIKRVHIKKAINRGIEILNTKNVNLQASTIEDAGESPVFVRYNGQTPGKLMVVGNTFKDNRGNVLIAFKGNASDRSRISENIFDHNHRWALFHTCPGAPDNACSGGQLLLESGLENIDITGNTIINGGIENYCTQLGASGIEFQTGGMSGVSILSNSFENNTGAAIAFNPSMQSISSVSIQNNKFIRNQRGNIVFYEGESESKYGVSSSNNCADDSCQWPVISSSYVDTNPQIWNGSLTASNLRTGLYVRLVDRDGLQWGDDLVTYLSGDRSWLSFSFPSNTAPSGCNIDFPCIVQAQLYEPLSGFISNKIDVNLPSSHQTAQLNVAAKFIYDLSNSVPGIHTPFSSSEYNAVSFQDSGFSAAPSAYIYKNFALWKGGLASTLATGGKWFSFSLPEAESIRSACPGLSCGLQVRVLDLNSCKYSNFSPLPLPSVNPRPEITAIYLNQNYKPWAVGIAGDNLQQSKSAVLLDQGKEWQEIPVTPYPNVTFNLPANSPPSSCNVSSSCKIQVMLKDSYGQLSKPFPLEIPSVQPPPVLQAASINTAYSPWAVGVSGTGLSKNLKAKLTDNSVQWGSLIQTFYSEEGKFVSFSLPSNMPPSKCNLNGPCSVQLQLVTEGGVETNSISLELPKSQ